MTAEQREYGTDTESEFSRDQHLRAHTGGSIALFFVDPPPYGEFKRHINIVGEYWNWRFAVLERISAEHFASERFHERHTMMLLGRSENDTILGFCPRDRRQADIEGELLIGSERR
ncbi:MAG: hypothetical protein ABI625_19485 [bacterium]